MCLGLNTDVLPTRNRRTSLCVIARSVFPRNGIVGGLLRSANYADTETVLMLKITWASMENVTIKG